MKILIYLQYDNQKIEDVSLQLIAKTNEISKEFEDVQIIGFCVSNKDYDENNFTNLDINKLIYVKTPNIQEYSTIEYANIFCDVIEKEQPDIVFTGATNQGRDLAPRVATKLKTGLTADCTELQIDGKGKLLATRPTFGGDLFAQILCQTKPQMATVRPNVFKYEKSVVPKKFDIEFLDYDFVPSVEILEKCPKNDVIVDYSKYDIIFAGGMGLKTKENFELLKKLADKFNAGFGATRKAVEKGLADKNYQIGQTGQTVAPKIYFAIGISGAIQHMSGVEYSNIIVAVNPDKNAPVHKCCDYSIYQDAQTFIQELLNC